MASHAAAVAYTIAVVLALVAATLAWRERRTTPAAGALTLTLVGVVWWSAADLARVLGPARRASAMALASYPGVTATVAGFFCLALACADPRWAPRRRTVLLLLVEPAAFVLCVATNPLHHLVHQPVRTGVWTLGPGYWAHTGYSYLLLGSGIVVMLRAWLFATRFHRRQLAEILCATTALLLLNLATLLGVVGDRTTDFTPLGFSVTGAVCAHAILRRELLHFVPVARELVLDRIDDAVLVIAPDGRIADLNPAAADLLGRAGLVGDGEAVGRPVDGVLGREVTTVGDWTGVHRLETAHGVVDLDVRVTRLPETRAARGGLVLVGRDITELSRQRRELAQANETLREQVRTIESLRAELAELATRDPLTGLHNRRHLDERMRRLLLAAAGSGEPFAVVMVDVDHFKRVNDGHGHQVGDALLVAVAGVLRAEAGLPSRPTGEVVAARHGGEEFVLLLPGYDLDGAAVAADRLRRRCAGVTVPGRDGAGVSCTVSAGVAAYPVCGATGEVLLRAADEALYAAKAGGRDTVVCAPPLRGTTRPGAEATRSAVGT